MRQLYFSRFKICFMCMCLVLLTGACISLEDEKAERILYLAPDSQEKVQLFAAPLVADTARQVTRAEFGVIDYRLSPMGQSIVYVALRADGGTNLWQVSLNGKSERLLLDCEQFSCTEPAWSPDGKQLIYSRQVSAHSYQLWLFDMETSQTWPLFAGEETLGFSARWSPDGKWINYVSPLEQGIRIYNMKNGDTDLVYSQMGQAAEWSPDGNDLLLTDASVEGEIYTVQLLKYNLQSGQLSNLSNSIFVDDGSPLWSNSGAQIAFGRKAPQAAMGKQLWLMQADGSQTAHLSDETDIHHVPLAWSPDDRYLLYKRFPFTENPAIPSVWALNLETGETWQVAANSQQASWLP